MNYAGGEELAKILVDYGNTGVTGCSGWNVVNGKQIINPNWGGRNAILCPSSYRNPSAGLWDSGTNNTNASGGYNAWYKWGGMEISYYLVGANYNYWTFQTSPFTNQAGPSSNNVRNFVSTRRSGSAFYPSANAFVTEACWLGTGSNYASNGHQAQGMNIIAMDGSGKWVAKEGLRPVVFGNGPPYMGQNRYGSPSVFSTQYVPKGYWYSMNYYGMWVTRGDTDTDERYWRTSAGDVTAEWCRQMGFSPFNF